MVGSALAVAWNKQPPAPTQPGFLAGAGRGLGARNPGWVWGMGVVGMGGHGESGVAARARLLQGLEIETHL